RGARAPPAAARLRWLPAAGGRPPPAGCGPAPAPRTPARPPGAARAWPVTPPAGGRGPARRQPAAEVAPLPLSVLLADLLPYLRLKRSTRPAGATSFCLPVEKGWDARPISTWIAPFVEPVTDALPQGHTAL